MTIGRSAQRAMRPNNGHGHCQLWTKYVVHIMLHNKHDKYSDNGKYGPNSSNNRPTREPGVTPAPAGGERLLLPVPRDPSSSQSCSQYSRGMKGGRSFRSRDTPADFQLDFTTPAPVQNSTLSADFRGQRELPTNHCWCQSSRVIALWCGIKMFAVHHLVLSQSTYMTDRQMDR